MIWLLGFAAFLLFFYYFLYKPQHYWTQRNVKQGPAIPLLGDNVRALFRLESFVDMTNNAYKRFPDARYMGMYQGTLPTLLIRDPELLKQIGVKDFDHFVDHRQFASETTDLLWCRNLVSLKGDEWRGMRATLSPTFTSSKMRSMFTLMEQSAQQYVNFYLEKKQNVIDLELKDSFTRFANDVIANCAFGIQVDSLKNTTNDFYVNGKAVTNFGGFWIMCKFIIMAMSPKFSKFLRISLFPQSTTDFFTTLVRDTVKLREEQNIVRPDMINLLMEARKGRLRYEESNEPSESGFATVQESDIGKKEHLGKIEMTDLDMAAQVMIFFAAGFDTIATMVSFMGYELALHPDIQDKLRKEVDETYQQCNGKLTYDLLNKMKYMDMVISESMRKNPPAIFTDRICTKDYTIQPECPGETPLKLKTGDAILFPICSIHHDEKYYPNPEKFDPERFSDENKSNIQPYTYLPFGIGPRNCVGSRFALLEVKTLIYHILIKFELVVIDKTVIPMKLSRSQFNPYIEGGFWVGLKRRENSVLL